MVNLQHATYVRRAGIGEEPVLVVRYSLDERNEPIRDFISAEGKRALADMKDGKGAPADWMTKRQWTQDLMSMLLESTAPVPRITIDQGKTLFGNDPFRREVKPVLPPSARSCVPPPSSSSTASLPPSVRAPLIAVKKELQGFKNLKRVHYQDVICLDSPSPAKKVTVAALAESARDPDDFFPAVGECPDEEPDDFFPADGECSDEEF